MTLVRPLSFLLPVAVAAVVMAVGVPASRPASDGATVIEMPKYGFSLHVPDGWRRMPKLENKTVALALERGQPVSGKAATLALVEFKEKSTADPKRVAEQIGKAATKTDPNAQISPVTPAFLGGLPAHRLTVVKKIKEIETRMMYLLAEKDGSLYIVVENNDASDDPMPDTLEKSFLFTTRTTD